MMWFIDISISQRLPIRSFHVQNVTAGFSLPKLVLLLHRAAAADCQQLASLLLKQRFVTGTKRRLRGGGGGGHRRRQTNACPCLHALHYIVLR